MPLLEAHIEEFEQGTWVADLIADQAFNGTFQLIDGSTWVGTKVAEIQDRGRYFSKVVGGKGSLGATVLDAFYQGKVSLQVIVNAVCASAGGAKDKGETAGNIAPGVFLEQYQRFVGLRSEALDAIAKAAGGAVTPGADPLLWWIDRAGLLQMQLPNATTGGRVNPKVVTGTQDMNKVEVDGSVELAQPSNAELGAMYGTPAQAVRHIRWSMTQDKFTARLFFVPFIFRAPVQTKYDRMYEAKIIADNGDGTVDVLAYRSPSEGKAPAFNVSKAQLFCGVPGSKVKMSAGETVTLGFFAGDPQKPFCMSMKQDTSVDPTKKVARNGDTVKVTLAAGLVATPSSIAGLAALLAPALQCAAPGSPCTPTPGYSSPTGYDITGEITSGSARILIGDA
jgi:hypothetical protein